MYGLQSNCFRKSQVRISVSYLHSFSDQGSLSDASSSSVRNQQPPPSGTAVASPHRLATSRHTRSFVNKNKRHLRPPRTRTVVTLSNASDLSGSESASDLSDYRLSHSPEGTSSRYANAFEESATSLSAKMPTRRSRSHSRTKSVGLSISAPGATKVRTGVICI